MESTASLTINQFNAGVVKDTPTTADPFRADLPELKGKQPAKKEKNPRNPAYLISAIVYPASVLAEIANYCSTNNRTFVALIFDRANRLNSDPNPKDPNNPGIPLGKWNGISLAVLKTDRVPTPLSDDFEIMDLFDPNVLDPNGPFYSGGTPIPPPPT